MPECICGEKPRMALLEPGGTIWFLFCEYFCIPTVLRSLIWAEDPLNPKWKFRWL